MSISGIYRLDFPNGSCYVGKSIDIERRFTEHANALGNGMAAKTLQNCYNSCGSYVESIVAQCHKDHISVLETLFIKLCAADLNTAPSAPVSDKDLEILRTCCADYFNLSSAELIALLDGLAGENKDLKVANEKLCTARTEEEMATQVGRLLTEARTRLRAVSKQGVSDRLQITDLQKEIKTLRKRNLWQRICNT